MSAGEMSAFQEFAEDNGPVVAILATLLGLAICCILVLLVYFCYFKRKQEVQVIMANENIPAEEGDNDDDVVIADMNQEGAATTKTTPGAHVDASMGYRKSTVGSTLDTADGMSTGDMYNTSNTSGQGDGTYTVPRGDTEDLSGMYESGGTTTTGGSGANVFKVQM